MALHFDLLRQRMGNDLQIGPFFRRLQIGHGRTAPAPVARGQLEKSDTFLIGTVVVGIEFVAGGLCGRDPGVGNRTLDAHVRHPKRPLVSVELVRPAFVALGALEQGQHIVPSPAAVAHLPPPVVILRLATHVQQTIERRRATENLATRPFDGAPVQARIRFGLVAPVHRRIVNGFEISHRDMDPRVQVPSAGFKKNDLVFRVCTQAVCKHATGRSGSHNDEIRFHNGLLPAV